MYRGRFSRQPYSRGLMSILVIVITFFAREIHYKLQWSFSTLVEFFSVKVNLFLSVFRYMVSIAIFFISKVSLSVSRQISLTRFITLYTKPIHIMPKKVLKLLIAFFSRSSFIKLRTITVSTVIFNLNKVFLRLTISLWGFAQEISKGIVSKYCNIKGGVRK